MGTLSQCNRTGRYGAAALLVLFLVFSRSTGATNFCYDWCGPNADCDTACELSPSEWVTCGEWGTCDHSCPAICDWYEACTEPCGSGSTCGAYGECGLCIEDYCGDGACQGDCGETSNWCDDCPDPEPLEPPENPGCYTDSDCDYLEGGASRLFLCYENTCVRYSWDFGGPWGCGTSADCGGGYACYNNICLELWPVPRI